MTRRLLLLIGPFLILSNPASAAENLLLNPQFAYHAFDNSRTGSPNQARAGSVPCWNQERYGDAEVYRGSRAPRVRPQIPVEGVVIIHPGKKFQQFALLAELGLDHGERVSLAVHGQQTAPNSLQGAVHCMRLDSQTGTWTAPPDTVVYPRHARGELVRGPSYTGSSGEAAQFVLKVENCEVLGALTENADQSTDQPNTIGLLVEFENTSKDTDVAIYAPCLARGETAQLGLAAARPLPSYYRSIPRTLQKLWRGEPLHIIVMGSSIDRGSANPRQLLYDEDPKSPAYKQPVSPSTEFDGAKVGHPEWNDYIGWWQHHFMYGGRLRQLLMQKFDYPIDKLLLNTMASDGSSISESHSGLADYASLAIQPSPHANGHRAGKSWRELYPALFARPEGPRPDLVIFGSGANERIDGADEIACFEGALRWFQRNYPETEFICCMWQNRDGYTAAVGHMAELSQRYQFPYVDLSRLISLTTRYCNSYALVPRDGHPQAAAHYLWAKQLERVFDVADPFEPGIAQRRLPSRISPFTVGWEGEMRTYAAGDPRLPADKAFLFDDAAINLWAITQDKKVTVRIDGAEHSNSGRLSIKVRDVRNSTFAVGRLALGDRHIVEVAGTDSKLVAVDSKLVVGRQWIGVESPLWKKERERKPEPFQSPWGYPYGRQVCYLETGTSATIDAAGTDFSICWLDSETGGTLEATLDGEVSFSQPTHVPFRTAEEKSIFGENRRGIRGVPYGLHTLRVTAREKPVALLGVFGYDTRANRSHERVLRGYATPGETLTFEPPFRARPLVLPGGDLRVASEQISRQSATFFGTGPGVYEIVGE